jgi:integrase
MEKPERPNVSSRINPSGDRIYRLDYKNPLTGKRVRSVVGSVKKDAEKKADQLYREMMAKYVGEPESTISKAKITDVIEEFFLSKENRIRPSTVGRYRIYTTNFTDYMSENFRTIKYVDQIRDVHINKFLKFLKTEKSLVLKKGQTPGTINANLRVLKSVLKFSVNSKYLHTNPAENIEKLLDFKKSEEVLFWSSEQVKTILEEVNSHWHDMYEFLYHTGIREGELINLKWDAVILEGNPRIKIQASDGWIPKTNERREIHLNRIALGIVNKQTHSGEHDYVFKSFEGNKIKAKTIYDNLKSALKRLGLPGSVHTFRHTFASHLVMKGIGLETISKLLGHSSIEMTMKYAHLAPDHLRKAVDVLVDE